MACNPELPSILDSLSIQDLLSTIRKKAKSGNKDVVSYIRAIFQGSSDRSDTAENRRFETFKCSLSLLQMKDFPSNLASELLSLLILKVDLFQTSNLVKLCEMFVEHSKSPEIFSNRWLEMFSKVLTCLPNRDSIVYEGKDTSGAELRKNIICSIFSDSTNTSCLVQIAAVLKDVELTDEEINLIIDQLLKILPSVDLIELPAYVYQVLLLSSKGKCHHVFQSIITYFMEKDKEMQHLLYDGADSDLISNQDHVDYRQTEGTVILMISVMCRHDQRVGREFLLLLKQLLHKPHLLLSPFTFSTALSLSKIDRIADEVFDALKKSVVAAFQHKEKRQYSIWFRNLVEWDVDILKLVKEAIQCSKFGWDHVCQGLVKFGFVALDGFGPRCIGGNITKGVCPEGCDLGSNIIRDTFKSHRLVRQEIFEQILNRIIAKSQKPVSHYIDILSQIVQSDPLFLLDVLPKLVEVLDYLHFLPHLNAEKVLQSLAPLLKISAPLKDTLMVVLRKALFHRDMEARKVAVCGYLTILKNINFTGKVSLSQSQTSMTSRASSSMISTQMKADVYVSAGNITSKTMCLEIMGLLKRVLMQQAEITQLLYEGLYDVVLHNKSLKDIILELLLCQFEKYYNVTESEIPVHFTLCFQSHKNMLVLKEPLAHLITTTFLILNEGSNDIADEDYDQSAQKMLENIMQKLLERMLDVDDTDFHLGKETDVNESQAEHNLKIKLLLNIYEALLEHSFIQNLQFESDSCEEFLKLYHKYKNILDSITKKKQGKTSKSAKAQQGHNCFSHVTLRFFAKVMESLFIDETFRHQEGLNVLRSDSNFVTNIITACNQKLTKMGESGQIDGFSQVMKDFFKYITTIGKVMMKTYSDGISTDFSSLEWDKVSCLFAEGLNQIFHYVHTYHKKNMNKFIINVCNDSCLSMLDALQYILKNIQQSVMKLLSDTDDDSNLKDCVPLLSVIKTLHTQYMTEFKEDVYKWIRQLCSQQVFQNVAVARAFLSLCFSLGHQNENFLGFLKDVAFDIRYHLGNIDPDESVTGNPTHDIITLEVARNVIPVLFTNLEKCFDEIEWILNFIKINILGENESMNSIYNRPNLEKGVCSHVSDVIHIFSEIVQTGVNENIANNILKLVARLYRILTALTKYYLLLHKNKSSELHIAFEKLVKLSNMKLTPQVYAFITFIQMLSGEIGNKKKKAKGNVGAFKAGQDVKTIPTLVFEIESFEKNLIILSKKYKKDLTNKMKLSTARDFRINAAVITSVLEQQENESVADATVEESTNEDTPDLPPNSPQNLPSHSHPVQNDSDNHMSIDEDSEDEGAQDENEPLNTSLNIFGENVPEKKKEAIPSQKKVQLNTKKKCLGIRRNTKH